MIIELGPLTEIQPLILDYWERSIIDQSKSIFIHQQRVHHHGGPPPPNPAAGTGAAGSGSNGPPPPPAAPSPSGTGNLQPPPPHHPAAAAALAAAQHQITPHQAALYHQVWQITHFYLFPFCKMKKNH